MLEHAVNGRLNDNGETAFADLHSGVLKGYVKPWFRGIEHVTIDHAGYVYWKGIQVEHYCTHRMTNEQQQTQTEELARRCLIVEGRGLVVTSLNVIWNWVEPLQPEAPRQSTTPISASTAPPTA